MEVGASCSFTSILRMEMSAALLLLYHVTSCSVWELLSSGLLHIE